LIIPSAQILFFLAFPLLSLQKSALWFVFILNAALSLILIFLILKTKKTGRPLPETRGICREPGEVSHPQPDRYEPKYRELMHSWGTLIENLEKMFHKSNEVNLYTQLESEIIQKEVSKIQSVFEEIQGIQKNGEGIQSRIRSIASFSGEIKQETGESIRKISDTHEKMIGIYESNQDLKNSINNFIENTKQIEKFLSNISKIANKTRTLSINAAIEASKSGKHGSGFAVIAREVRSLSENTAQYAKNINNLLASIKTNSYQVMESMENNSRNIEEGNRFFLETSRYMEGLDEKMSSIDTMIRTISELLESTVSEVNRSFESVEALEQSSEGTKENTKHLNEIAQELSSLGETSMNMALQKPSASPLAKLMRKIARARMEIEGTLEQMLDGGIVSEQDLFDPQFVPVPNTDPQRYDCSYQPEVNNHLKPILTQYKEEIPGIINFIVIDMKKYCPTAPDDFDQPLTGNAENDAKINFTRRIYDIERVEYLNHAVDDRDFYLTSYPRLDFKITLSDLVFPIFVRGKRWGTGRVGFNPEQIEH
jgi:methyl-accepting chemotaxis protein